MRPSGRASDALRDVSITTGFARHSEGSCLIKMGGTEVLCVASVAGKVPSFLRGTGLGLSLSKKLAVMLGGDVMVTSQVGQGSTFSVVIPSRIPGHDASGGRGASPDRAGNDGR